MKLKSKFKLHLGEYVHKCIENSELPFKDVAKKLSIEKSTLTGRCKKPHYGTVYDLMSTSLAINQNLFGVVIAAIKKEDLEFSEYYTTKEVDELKQTLNDQKQKIKLLEKEKKSLFSVIDTLTVK